MGKRTSFAVCVCTAVVSVSCLDKGSGDGGNGGRPAQENIERYCSLPSTRQVQEATQCGHSAMNCTFDSQGRVLTQEWLYGGQVTEVKTYVYDAKGNLLEWVRRDADGGQVDRSVSEYDESGRLLSTEVWSDSDGDGVPDWRKTITYDRRGNRLTELMREDGFEQLTRNTYDENDRLVLTEDDADNDGEIERWTRYVYDEAGQLLLVERRDDTRNPEFWVPVVRRTYDDAGNLVVQVDEFGRMTCAHEVRPTGGEFVTCEIDSDQDGDIDARTRRTNNGDGDIVHIEYDWGGDGVFDESGTYTYDDEGNRLSTPEFDGGAYDWPCPPEVYWCVDNPRMFCSESGY